MANTGWEGGIMIVQDTSGEINCFGTLADQQRHDREIAPVKAEARRAARAWARGFTSMPDTVAVERASSAAFEAAGFDRFLSGFRHEFAVEVARLFPAQGIDRKRCWWYQTGAEDAKRRRKAKAPNGATAEQRASYTAGYHSARQ